MQQEKSYYRPLSEISYTLGMDPVRALILEKSQLPGNSLQKWSKAIGRNTAYLHQFIHKNSPVKLDEDDRRKLAAEMGVAETDLMAEGAAPSPSPRAQQNARFGGAVQLGSKIPVYGHAVGGSAGQFILNGNKIDDVLAPPSLANVSGAYAVYVVGESMLDRYEPGEMVFVNPRVPVRRGDYVIVQIKGDDDVPEAYLKRFLNQDSRVIRLEQLNPKKVLEFPSKKVVSVHRVIMGGDG